jgi:radical SAM protein with 4Fe4S-binding SPASM domain
MKVFMVFFGGGEPLCQKDFMDIAAYTKNQGIEMCLLSNLTLIDAGIAQQLRDVGFYKIEGNLDGNTSEVYEALRQTKGSFQRTIQGIRHCVNVGLPVRVNCTLTRLNYKYIREIVELACNLGVMDIAFLRLIPAGRGDENFVKLDVGDDFYSKELVPKLNKLRTEFAGKIGIGFEQETELNKLSDPNNTMPWCGSGRIHCTITPEGNVKPDPSFPDNDPKAIAGNILNDNFRIIWSGSEIFRKIRHTRFSGCQNCRHIQCAGGDVYRIYHHYGEIMAHRDPRCMQNGAE